MNSKLIVARRTNTRQVWLISFLRCSSRKGPAIDNTETYLYHLVVTVLVGLFNYFAN